MSVYTAITRDPDRRYDPPDEIPIEDDDELLSECCTANAWGEIHSEESREEGEPDEYWGICSACREHAKFTGEES